MKHLDESTALSLAEDQAVDQRTLAHLAACPRCAAMVEEYRALLAAFAAARAPQQSPSQSLQRWALAYAGLAGGQRQQSRLLPLLASSFGPRVAVRGQEALAEGAFLFGDKQVQLDVRVQATVLGGSTIHGQVVSLPPQEQAQWQIWALSQEGRLQTATTDDQGEFWLEELPARSSLSLVLANEHERLVIPHLEPGTEL